MSSANAFALLIWSFYAMTQLDVDTFTRSNTAGNTTISNAAGWGTASGGSVWSASGGAYTYSIASNAGKITGATALIAMFLGSVTSADGDITCRIKLDDAASTGGVLLRSTATGTYYRAGISGGNTLTLDKRIAGVNTNLTTTTFNYTTTDLVHVRFRLQGTHLVCKAWKDGNTEPDWMLWTTDTSISAASVGNFGLRANLGANGDTALFDSLVINDLSAAYTVQSHEKFFTKNTALKTITEEKSFTRIAGLKDQSEARYLTRMASLKDYTRTQFSIIKALKSPTQAQFVTTYENMAFMTYFDTFYGRDGTLSLTGSDGIDTLVGIG